MTPDERVVAERDFRKSQTFLGIFAEKVEPSLAISRSIGNVYSGSLPLALASLLSQGAEQIKSLAGKRTVFLAYGSGATARVFGGKFTSSLAKSVLPLPLSQISRQPVSFEDYERLHAHSEVRTERNGDAMVTPLGLSVLKPRDEFVYLGMKALPVSELGLRLYKYQS
jgi:hydroxymethylglutaryl-CoA synthase